MNPIKIRFLLTGRCTATCAYCHNEGQSKPAPMLSLSAIRHVLETLRRNRIPLQEIVLSGGEPTLHKELGSIAALCAQSGVPLSLNSHGGHPDRLQDALPYLHEFKLHLDSFDPDQQFTSMGIALHKVWESIALAQSYPTIRILTNHPVQSWEETRRFVQNAHAARIDCKLIDLLNDTTDALSGDQLPWHEEGYLRTDAATWQHRDTHHQIHTRQCDGKRDRSSNTLFIGADGVRRFLNGPVLGRAENF